MSTASSSSSMARCLIGTAIATAAFALLAARPEPMVQMMVAASSLTDANSWLIQWGHAVDAVKRPAAISLVAVLVFSLCAMNHAAQGTTRRKVWATAFSVVGVLTLTGTGAFLLAHSVAKDEAWRMVNVANAMSGVDAEGRYSFQQGDGMDMAWGRMHITQADTSSAQVSIQAVPRLTCVHLNRALGNVVSINGVAPDPLPGQRSPVYPNLVEHRGPGYPTRSTGPAVITRVELCPEDIEGVRAGFLGWNVRLDVDLLENLVNLEGPLRAVRFLPIPPIDAHFTFQHDDGQRQFRVMFVRVNGHSFALEQLDSTGDQPARPAERTLRPYLLIESTFIELPVSVVHEQGLRSLRDSLVALAQWVIDQAQGWNADDLASIPVWQAILTRVPISLFEDDADSLRQMFEGRMRATHEPMWAAWASDDVDALREYQQGLNMRGLVQRLGQAKP